VVSFTPLPLYAQGKKPHHPFDRRIGGPRSGLDDIEKRKFLTYRDSNSERSVIQLASHYTDYAIEY
jgi:hypothetical protein